jgi:tetratricopeptide (TPR) repeat protein
VQDEIARSVVQALRVKLLPGQRELARAYQPRNPEAYQSYLLGKHFAQSFSQDSNQRAVEAFEKAVEIDPEYPQAWAGLVGARLGTGTWGAAFAEARQGARIAANRAVGLAPDMPEALASRASSRLADWDWSGAKSDIDRALEMDPGSAEAMSAMVGYLAAMGRPSETLPWSRRIIDREPLSSGAWNSLGIAFWFSGQYTEAEKAFDRAVEVDPAFRVYLHRALLLVDAGRPDEALGLCRNDYCLAIVHHALGNAAQSQKALDALLMNPNGDWNYVIAKIYSVRGETDRAFEWLGRAIAEHVRILPHLKSDPAFRPLHSDPRWAELLRKMNLPVD